MPATSVEVHTICCCRHLVSASWGVADFWRFATHSALERPSAFLVIDIIIINITIIITTIIVTTSCYYFYYEYYQYC